VSVRVGERYGEERAIERNLFSGDTLGGEPLLLSVERLSLERRKK
jgi:hypothetical protein